MFEAGERGQELAVDFTRSLKIVDHLAMSEEELGVLGATLGPLHVLQDLLRVAFAQSPPWELAEVVVQDEFTHDVVLTWTSGRFLVFDTT